MLKLSTIYNDKYSAGMTTRRETTFELVQLVIRLGERMRQHYARRADEFELTPTQAQVLRELTAGPAPMGELAVRLSCDASNMTGVSDRLEARGLLERLPSPGDRRVKVLSLTDDGRMLHRRLWSRLMENSPVAEGLTETEQQTLKALLQKLERAGSA
jgi:DNA-binding MarR family transcriptional regulator